MGLSNMLSKLFKKENEDFFAQNPVKFKDFDSIIVPPEPKTRSILVYKTLNLGLEFTPNKKPGKLQHTANSSYIGDDAVLLTDDIVEDIIEED